MPIHSPTDVGAENGPDTDLAAAAVTSSLAATAASLLRNNPHMDLAPRLRRALETMHEHISKLANFDEEDARLLMEPRLDNRPDVDQALAKIATMPEPLSDVEYQVEGLQEALSNVASQIEELLATPTTEVAENIEEFLGILSTFEMQMANRTQLTEETDEVVYA